MSDQLSKPLYGQYTFSRDADRIATLANIGVGSVAKVLTYATTVDIDWSTGNVFYIAATGALTLTFSNKSEKTIRILILETGTNALTFPAAKWNGGSAAAAPADTKYGLYEFRVINGVTIGNAISVNLS